MSTVWLAVILLAVGTWVLKGVGPVLLGTYEPGPRTTAVIALLAPALLAALVVYQTFSDGPRSLGVDARVVGLAVAGVAVALRLPMIVVVGLAALATALTRLIF